MGIRPDSHLTAKGNRLPRQSEDWRAMTGSFDLAQRGEAFASPLLFILFYICLRSSLRISSPKKGRMRYSPSNRDCTCGE